MLAVTTWILLFGSALLAVIYVVLSTIMRRRREGEPEIVKGKFLWGNAIDFNTHAVNFLLKTAKTYGNVFTLRLVNQHITIVNDVHSYEALHKERNFDFDPIQKQVNWNVFSFVLKDARKMIKDTGRTVRGENLGKCMTSFADKLDESFTTVMTDKPTEGKWIDDGLRKFAGKTLFDALFNTIFGSPNGHVFNSQNTYHNFEVFHKYFNHFWLGVPKALFPSAMKALGEMVQQPGSDELLSRPDASDYIRTAVTYMKEKGQTESDISGHNLVYLHVNYNTFRLAFWVMADLLENKAAYQALMEELQEAIAVRRVDDDSPVEFTGKDIENLPILESVCQESLRLSSGVFMVRYVQEDTWFSNSQGQKYLIRKGDRVAMYPPAIHKDPEIFEDPLTYKYDRFVDQKFYKGGKEVKNPVIGFGSLCPGKRYAILQLKWFVMTTLARFEMVLNDGEHAVYDSQYHGHEILPPVEDIQMRYRVRENHPTLKFV